MKIGYMVKMQMKKLQYALQGAVELQCTACMICFNSEKDRDRHIEKNSCPAIHDSYISTKHKIFGFTLDDRTFSCHLGCNNYSTQFKKQMADHLL